MHIKSVKLQNIRSYTSQTIEFPDGSVLLSGDIGSGKSTILLAVEFALFGVRKPFLSGNTMLRKGAKHGSVELRLEIDDKDIIIKRNLKRGTSDIKQDSGYMIIDGVKTEATAVELKSRVIDLLGYPKDLVTKHRDIIYRYTVYTPQEDMKTILFEDKESRLNTLRKVFGIDKYKRIRENCIVYIREIKDRKKEYTGRIYDLEDKQKQKKDKYRELAALVSELSKLIPDIDKIKKRLDKKKQSITRFEKDIIRLSELKKGLAVCETDLKNRLEQRKTNTDQLEKIRNNILTLKKQLPAQEINIEKTSIKIAQLEKEISHKEQELAKMNAMISEYSAVKKASQELKGKISSMKQCPVCRQEVTDKHKRDIAASEHEKLIDLDKQYAKHFAKLKELEPLIAKIKDELQKMRAAEKEALVTNANFKRIHEMQKTAESIDDQQHKIKKKIGEINVKKIEIGRQLHDYKGIENEYTKAKKELEILLAEDKKIEMQRVGLEKTIEAINNDAEQLEDEIKKKLEDKKKIQLISQLQNWLEEYFINLMIVMEKHIMSQLYREFNECFVNWFSILIDDESIAIRLDDEFSPVVEQNGYETELENLSGGEKTSVALAYRLALNKVIHDYISHIKTRDIIILDEPTDGFSNDQLDRVRDVLEQLNVSQIIIVSHESKIESFVDNIIRVSKEEHVSAVG